MTHSLLDRQLRKSGYEIDKLMELVGAAYVEYERALKRQEHAMRLTSAELIEANALTRRESERKVAENRKAFDSASDGMWDWDVAADSLWLSSRATDVLGLPSDRAEKFGIEDWYTLVASEDRAAARAFIQRCIDTRTRQAAVLRFSHASGGQRRILCSASVAQDGAKNVSRVVCIQTDIMAHIP